MIRHPYVLMVIQGMLYCCSVDEGISSLLESGRMPWKAVRKNADPDFLKEAAEILREPFRLEDK